MNNGFEGVYSLLLTPFHEDKTIHWDMYDRYVDWQLSKEPNGLFAVCGTSEMKWLERDERLNLARRAVWRAGDVPVVATGNLDADPTKHADEVRRIAETGVAGVVLVPPLGMGADMAQLEEHFASLIDVSPVPVFIYEWPQTSPYLIPATMFASLVNHHGLRGIKDTTCTLSGISEKLASVNRSSATVYQANIPYLLDALDAGAGGVMAVVSGCFGDWVVDLWRQRKDEVGRDQAHARLLVLDLLLRMCYPTTSKFLVEARGIDIGLTTRWPAPLSQEAAKALSVFMKSLTLHE